MVLAIPRPQNRQTPTALRRQCQQSMSLRPSAARCGPHARPRCVPRWNAPAIARSKPSRSRRNRRAGVRATMLAVRGTSRRSATSPKYAPGPRVCRPRRPGPRPPDPTGSRERVPLLPCSMIVCSGATLTHAPARGHRPIVAPEARERRERAKLRRGLEGRWQVGDRGQAGEQAVERALVDEEQLAVLHCLHGRRSGGPADETQLAEGLASAQDPEHTLVPESGSSSITWNTPRRTMKNASGTSP